VTGESSSAITGIRKSTNHSSKKQGVFMDANSWLWIALIAFLVFCCGPMLSMGKRRRPLQDEAKEEGKNPSR